MATIQIPPSGQVAEFGFNIPAPPAMVNIGGVRLYFTFAVARPENGNFAPLLLLDFDDEPVPLSDSAVGLSSVTKICQLDPAIFAPITARLRVNETGELEPGNTVTIYAWGAQTPSGTGALNPDEGGEPSMMTDTIEVGTVEIVTWEEWYRIVDRDGSGS